MNHAPTPIRERLVAAFWGDGDTRTPMQAEHLADVVLWRFHVGPKEDARKLAAFDALVAACQAALKVSHDPAVEQILMDALAAAEEGTAPEPHEFIQDLRSNQFA